MSDFLCLTDLIQQIMHWRWQIGLVAHAFTVISKKMSPNPVSWRFYPIIFLKVLVLALMLNSYRDQEPHNLLSANWKNQDSWWYQSVLGWRPENQELQCLKVGKGRYPAQEEREHFPSLAFLFSGPSMH